MSISFTCILYFQPEKPVVKKAVKEEPKPDLSNPVEIKERQEIIIKGRKYVLMENPETKQMCAYPYLPPPGTLKTIFNLFY